MPFYFRFRLAGCNSESSVWLTITTLLCNIFAETIHFYWKRVWNNPQRVVFCTPERQLCRTLICLSRRIVTKVSLFSLWLHAGLYGVTFRFRRKYFATPRISLKITASIGCPQVRFLSSPGQDPIFLWTLVYSLVTETHTLSKEGGKWGKVIICRKIDSK